MPGNKKSQRQKKASAAPVLQQPAIAAAYDDDVTLLLSAIQEGADLDAKETGTGKTASWVAAANNSLAVLRILIARGADVTTPDTRDGCTPLMIVCQKGNSGAVATLVDAFNGRLSAEGMEGVKELRKHCDQRNSSNQGTALWMICQNLHKNDDRHCADIVRRLVCQCGADVNLADDKKNFTPLHMVSEFGMVICADIIINASKPADLEARTRSGATPLFCAAQEGHTDMLTLLLESGADPDAERTMDGATAAHWAAKGGHLDCLKKLQEKGANLMKASFTNQGMKPFDVAAHFRQKSCMDYLQSSAASKIERRVAQARPKSGLLQKAVVGEGAEGAEGAGAKGICCKMVSTIGGMLSPRQTDAKAKQSCACCGVCKADMALGSKLRKCSGCGIVRYCSAECQKTHWSDRHKRECKRLAKLD